MPFLLDPGALTPPPAVGDLPASPVAGGALATVPDPGGLGLHPLAASAAAALPDCAPGTGTPPPPPLPLPLPGDALLNAWAGNACGCAAARAPHAPPAGSDDGVPDRLADEYAGRLIAYCCAGSGTPLVVVVVDAEAGIPTAPAPLLAPAAAAPGVAAGLGSVPAASSASRAPAAPRLPPDSRELGDGRSRSYPAAEDERLALRERDWRGALPTLPAPVAAVRPVRPVRSVETERFEDVPRSEDLEDRAFVVVVVVAVVVAAEGRAGEGKASCCCCFGSECGCECGCECECDRGGGWVK